MRDVTDQERTLLERIFAQLSDSESELQAQLRKTRVIRLDEEGSLGFVFVSPTSPLSRHTDNVPVTAIYDDSDGIPVYLLMHVKDGKLFELEIYKADGSKIVNAPAAEKLYF